MNNSPAQPNDNGMRSFTLEHLNAAILTGKEEMLACYIDNAIGIYCNLTGKSVGPRPARMSEYSGSYGDAYYIAYNAVYEVWTNIGATYNPTREFKPYYEMSVRNKIDDLLKSGGRTDLLSQPAKSKSKDDAFNKLSRVDADGYWGDSGSEPDNVEPDKQEKIRKFMSDELEALIKYLDGLPEKERTVFLASDFGRTFSSSPDKYGRDYAEALAEKYHTSAGYIRKLAALQKKKALEAVQKQGFNKQTFTAIEFIQEKPNYAETYDKVIEATEKLTPFEQFLLLKHIEDMRETATEETKEEIWKSMNIINKCLLTDVEQNKINEVLSFKLFDFVCFNDYCNRMEIEICPDKRERKGKEIARLELEKAYDEAIEAERSVLDHYNELKWQARNCLLEADRRGILVKIQKLQVKYGIAGQIVLSFRELLDNNNEDKIAPSLDVMGEFSESPSPKVTIYLGSISSSEESRYKYLIPTLIREMFHAVNYFHGGGPCAIREIDEPMAEFATGVFLKALSKVKVEYDIIAARHRSIVSDSSTGVGEIACFGFGNYLMDNVEKLSSFSEKEWIESYAKHSASISEENWDALAITEYLYPCYPIIAEEKVLRYFEEAIFHIPSLPDTPESENQFIRE